MEISGEDADVAYVMAHPRNASGKHESTANLQADNGTRNLNMIECQDTAKVHLKNLGIVTASITTTKQHWQ